jgi:hypothetical protein
MPAGAKRVARLDGRGPSVRRVPWLSASAVLAGALALLPGSEEPLTVITALLLCLAFGLVVEGWLGLGPALGSAIAGFAAAWGLVGLTSGGGAVTPQLLCAAWIGLLGFARTLREAELSVLTRGAIDTAALVAVAFSVVALTSGTPPRLLLAPALGGFLSGALLWRRRTPDS